VSTTHPSFAEPRAAIAQSRIRAADPSKVQAAGGAILRYGLVAILLYFGAFKFTAVEAEGIRPLVASSPFMSWMYSLAGVQAVSNVIGAVEIAVGLLIAARAWSPRLSFWGSVGASFTFLLTLSFLVTTPGIWATVPGFPLPVPNETGAFLSKDFFLLGGALWSAGEAGIAAARTR
jgi:uncharacterized membrane protein YkgB